MINIHTHGRIELAVVYDYRAKCKFKGRKSSLNPDSDSVMIHHGITRESMKQSSHNFSKIAHIIISDVHFLSFAAGTIEGEGLADSFSENER